MAWHWKGYLGIRGVSGVMGLYVSMCQKVKRKEPLDEAERVKKLA